MKPQPQAHASFEGSASPKDAAKFPRMYRRGFFGRLDRKFTSVFLCVLTGVSIAVMVLSRVRVENTVSQKSIEQVQDRFAMLVLDQPKKQPPPPAPADLSEEKQSRKKTSDTAEKVPRNPDDDQSQKSVAVRQEHLNQQRRQVRQEVSRQVSTMGLFAAITASVDGAGSGDKVTGSPSALADLLKGEGTRLADLGSAGSLSASFAATSNAETRLESRRAERSGTAVVVESAAASVEQASFEAQGEVTITMQPPEITSTQALESERSFETINRAVNRYTSRLKRVYENWLKKDPSLKGRLVIKFTIVSDGSVVNSAIVSSTTGNGEFDKTVLFHVSRWNFAPSDRSAPVEVVYPFVFEGAG